MRKWRGFTLVELVVVVSILGLLMSLVVPSISGALDRSRRSSAQNSLKQVAAAYIMYRGSYGDLTEARVPSIPDWALLMAREGYLNDPNAYVFSFDSKARSINTVKKDTIVQGDGSTYSQCWGEVPPVDANAFSINIVLGINDSCNASTTPIAFTRGLQEDGTWSSDGVFGKKGGYIAFLDGHVKWYSKVTGKLLKCDLSQMVSNILDAIPSSGTILDGTQTFGGSDSGGGSGSGSYDSGSGSDDYYSA